MAELVWASGEEAKAIQGLKDVRNDGSAVDWCFITYAGTSGPASSQLKFGGSGAGSVDDLAKNFAEDNISFALIRVSDKIDMSVTIKFCWINFTGPKTPRMMQSKLSVQIGAIQAFFKPYSTDLTTNNIGEVTQQVVMEKVLAYSVSGSKVMEGGAAGYRSVAAAAGGAKVQQFTGKMADGPITVEDSLRAEIRSIRDEKATNDWILVTYADPTKPNLVLLAKGTGAVAGLREHLTQDNVAYGLVRKTEKIDDTLATKFCYIRWLGKNVPFMLRAKLGTHAGDVYELFTPAHTSIDAPDFEDVTDEKVMRAIQTASGTYKHVLDAPQQQRAPAQAAPKPAATQAAPKPAASPKAAAAPKAAPKEAEDVINVGAGIREAIQSVRDDSNLIDWALVTYDMGGKSQSKNLVLVGTGEGGLSELKSKLSDNMIGYALYRTTERVDDSETVKFVFIDWRGPGAPRMQRSILGTQSGAVRELFHPYHVDVIDASKPDELTEEIITAKIKKAAGTANYVL